VLWRRSVKVFAPSRKKLFRGVRNVSSYDICFMAHAKLLWMLTILTTFLAPSSAWAHNMYVFAEAEGATIHGEVYFRGGTPARNVGVTAFDPAGEQIGQTRTGQDGKFTLQAQSRCDHRLLVHTEDGHGAEFSVAADQLPNDLPVRRVSPDSSGEEPPADIVAPAKPDDSAATVGSAQLESILREVARLRKRVNDYQREMRRYHQQMRLRDVLGGVGWIMGIAGIAFYFLGLRQRRKEPALRESSAEGPQSQTGS